MNPGRFFSIISLILASLFLQSCNFWAKKISFPVAVKTFAGVSEDKAKRFGEPFGVAFDTRGTLYVSDGEKGAIWRGSGNENLEVVTDKLNTPSAIAFDKDGALLVADSGSHTIRKVNVSNGEVSTLAGIENKSGYKDGDAGQSLFNAPIGLAISPEGKIFVADTYNDKIRVIENGKVSTLAGGARGFENAENGAQAKFDTPCGITIWKEGSLLVADTGNRRLRLIEQNGRTTTFAGTGDQNLINGYLFRSAFVQPTAIAVDPAGLIYVADGNAIRVIGRRAFPVIETINDSWRGFFDGTLNRAKFNRPSGFALDSNGNLFIADSENQIVRVLSDGSKGDEVKPEVLAKLRPTEEEFRALYPARWPYNPPENKRDIAGTLGEVRGEVEEGKDVWFHNGLDIAGGYGETARFMRPEKVLKPMAVENFDGLRELIRMPTMGYIHIRLGRDVNGKPFGDDRFIFDKDESGKLSGVRVRRGTKFEAGDAIGTLNSFNHVHLIAGRPGFEMNALAALELPGMSDKVEPKIEEVTLFDQNWQQISETARPDERINLKGKVRVVVRAYDQMNEAIVRRRLGLYRLGYQVFKEGETPKTEPGWNISFDKMPDERAARFVYAAGSKSGYTPETIFNYIVTNKVSGDLVKESFLDAGKLPPSNYTLRVLAADFSGNVASKDLKIEIR